MQKPTENAELFQIDSLQRAAFGYFLDHADPATGLIADTSLPGAPSSIAATGFGLSCYPIGVARGWISRREASRRVLTALRFLRESRQSRDQWASGYPTERVLVAAGMVATADVGAFGTFLIVRRSDGVVIGDCGFHGPPDATGAVTIGFEIRRETTPGDVPGGRAALIGHEPIIPWDLVPVQHRLEERLHPGGVVHQSSRLIRSRRSMTRRLRMRSKDLRATVASISIRRQPP